MIDKPTDKMGNVHIDYLIRTLDVEQWKSLSHIRFAPCPISLEDKRKFLSDMMIIIENCNQPKQPVW